MAKATKKQPTQPTESVEDFQTRINTLAVNIGAATVDIDILKARIEAWKAEAIGLVAKRETLSTK